MVIPKSTAVRTTALNRTQPESHTCLTHHLLQTKAMTIRVSLGQIRNVAMCPISCHQITDENDNREQERESWIRFGVQLPIRVLRRRAEKYLQPDQEHHHCTDRLQD